MYKLQCNTCIKSYFVFNILTELSAHYSCQKAMYVRSRLNSVLDVLVHYDMYVGTKCETEVLVKS